MNDAKRAHLDALAENTHLSRSELLRRLILGTPLPDPASLSWPTASPTPNRS
ncbi:ribbon-helix-helix protein, CopG family [Rhodospirillum sp. A1_3_36]|uniref:ribbon-helix-helix protein, CopG family n=1 Tax=Rhodospirillum sp. A1_3_36 TaxID=3391666 RepID=UPI0039A56EFF